MNLIDSHCHLYLDEFSPDREAVIQRATSEGVSKFYLPAIDSHTWPDLFELEKKYAGQCVPMMGLHPCSVKEDFMEELKKMEELLKQRDFAAIGEIGLDFYWDRKFEQEQYAAFRQQIGWALQYKMPIVIHSRESVAECIQVVKEAQNGKLTGIFHCFTGDYAFARQIIELGFLLGIGGVLTYKTSNLPETLKKIDLEYLVLETDAPYLTPVPFRGKRNESSYLKYIVEKLAIIKGVSREEVATISTQNALKIFVR